MTPGARLVALARVMDALVSWAAFTLGRLV